MEIKVKGEVVNESDDFRFVGDGFDLILRFLSACVEVGGEIGVSMLVTAEVWLSNFVRKLCEVEIDLYAKITVGSLS